VDDIQPLNGRFAGGFMDILFKDFEKRFFTPPPAMQGKRKMSCNDVVREMAETWVDSGGELGGFDEYYIEKLRAEIARLEK